MRERWLLLTIAGVQFTHILDFMIMVPLGPQFTRLFGISDAQFGLLVSAYTLSAGVSGLVAATYVDRFDRRSLLLVLYALFAHATLACGLAPGYCFLMGARIAAGMFGGVLSALAQTIVADVVRAPAVGAARGLARHRPGAGRTQPLARLRLLGCHDVHRLHRDSLPHDLHAVQRGAEGPGHSLHLLVGGAFTLLSARWFGRMIPGMAIITSAAAPSLRGTFMALNASVQSAAMGLASLVGGPIARVAAGRVEHYWVAGLIGVVASFVSIALARGLRLHGAGQGTAV